MMFFSTSKFQELAPIKHSCKINKNLHDIFYIILVISHFLCKNSVLQILFIIFIIIIISFFCMNVCAEFFVKSSGRIIRVDVDHLLTFVLFVRVYAAY